MKRVLAVLCVMVAAVAGVGVANAAEADGATGRIEGADGLCVDVPWNHYSDGQAVQVAVCSINPAQVWTAQGDTVVIDAVRDLCLDVADSGNVQLASCNGSDAQRWAHRGNALVSLKSEECLDSGDVSDGVKLKVAACDAQARGQTFSEIGKAPAGPPVQPGNEISSTTKKGVAIEPGENRAAAIADSGATWFYNWSMTGPEGQSAEFVPMVRRDDNPQAVTSKSPYLLGFNEPDIPEQDNLDVATALVKWRALEATGKKLGSPAVAVGVNTGTGWLRDFLAANPRVDFVTVHFYGQNFELEQAKADFAKYLADAHAAWKKPLWVTEFALIDYSEPANPLYSTPEQNAAFLVEAVKIMEGLDYVERYAPYLPADSGQTLARYGLYNGDQPTEAGKSFKALTN